MRRFDEPSAGEVAPLELTWQEKVELDRLAEARRPTLKEVGPPTLDEEVVRRSVSFAMEAYHRRVRPVSWSQVVGAASVFALGLLAIDVDLAIPFRAALAIPAGIAYALLLRVVLEADDLP